jgi:hypothetical protein
MDEHDDDLDSKVDPGTEIETDRFPVSAEEFEDDDEDAAEPEAESDDDDASEL